MTTLGTTNHPLRVAIVGSGPSGFYSAEALIDSGLDVEIDIFEKLPVPFGLVRFGVAPDHAKLKSVCQIFRNIAEQPQVRFFGNVALGADLGVEDLSGHYHATIIATGASSDRALGVPGEDLAGVHAAREFVGWYNGHPEYSSVDFDLSQEVAIVVGQGNVAIDVCRILSKSVDELRQTDIAEHALDALASSRIREIHLIGRRGPVQAKFTAKELRELGTLPGWRPVVDPRAMDLNASSETELQDASATNCAKNLKVLSDFAARPARGEKQIWLDFLNAPVAIQGDSRIEIVEIAKQRLVGPAFGQVAEPTGETFSLSGGVLFRSVGYKGDPLPGLPFNERTGTVLNQGGRVLEHSGNYLPGWYVSGWIKRGPTGIIGTNRADSLQTVMHLIEDLPSLNHSRLGRTAILEMLRQRSTQIVSLENWLAIEMREKQRGAERSKVAEKFVSISDMLLAGLSQSKVTAAQ
jgi:ferredoxin--NADP+ reductase